MPLRQSDSVRNAKADAAVDLLDVGGAGTIKIYSGSQPATPATAASGTLLATVTLPSPAFGSASGTAGWARFADGAGTTRFDGDVTVTGGGGVVTLSSTSLTSGAPVDITGGTWTEPMS